MGVDAGIPERVIVVVGVTSEIARSVAATVARERDHLVVVDSDEAAASEVASEAIGRGVQAHSIVADLTSEVGANRVASYCGERWGRVDALLCCASALDTWALDQDTLERWRDVFELNVWGPVAYTRVLLPLLLRSRGGSIVYLSSIDGLRGNTNLFAFSMSKGSLVPLTQMMADKYGPRGLRVNCVASAGITQIAKDVVPERRLASDELVRLTPLRRLPVAEEIASVMVFLASERASYVTGTILRVDGGRLAATPGTYLDESEEALGGQRAEVDAS